MSAIRPLGRTAELLTEELDDELLIYDEQRMLASIAPTAAAAQSLGS